MHYIKRLRFPVIKYVVGLALLYLGVSVGGEPVRQLIISTVGLAIIFNGFNQAERRMSK